MTTQRSKRLEMSKSLKKHSDPKYQEVEYSTHVSRKTKMLYENKKIKPLINILRSKNPTKLLTYEDLI
jgi:hypothetical protein